MTKLNVLTLGALALSGFSLFACRATDKNADELKSFTADDGATNVALVFGAANGLPGVDTDLTEFSALLDSGLQGFTFQVQKVPEATKEMILAKVKAAAAQVGESGTLLLYFSGHGDQLGRYITNSSPLAFDELSPPLVSGRTSPLRRLIVLNDSCFSGNWVNGQGALGLTGAPSGHANRAPGKPSAAEEKARLVKSVDAIVEGLGPAGPHQRSKGIYDQLFVFAAARKDQTAQDLGAYQGGAFTYHLRTEIANLNASQPNAEFQDLIDSVTQATANENGHTPQYRTVPTDLVAEPLFKAGSLGTASNSTSNGNNSGAFPAEVDHAKQIVVGLNDKLASCGAIFQGITIPADALGWYTFKVTFNGAVNVTKEIRGNNHNPIVSEIQEVYADPAVPQVCKSSNVATTPSNNVAGFEFAEALSTKFSSCKFVSQGLGVGGASSTISLQVTDASGQQLAKNYTFSGIEDLVQAVYLDPSLTARCKTTTEATLLKVLPIKMVDIMLEMNRRVSGCAIKLDHTIPSKPSDPPDRVTFYAQQESNTQGGASLLQSTYVDTDKPVASEAEDILKSYGSQLVYCTLVDPNADQDFPSGSDPSDFPPLGFNPASTWGEETVERLNAMTKNCSNALVSAAANSPSPFKARFSLHTVGFISGVRKVFDKVYDVQGAANPQDQAAILGAALQSQFPSACSF